MLVVQFRDAECNQQNGMCKQVHALRGVYGFTIPQGPRPLPLTMSGPQAIFCGLYRLLTLH